MKPQVQTQAPPPPQKIVASEALFEGAQLVEIVHAGERYLLRITRQNKLILTK